MNDRHNFYKLVHKGIRALLADLVDDAGRTNFADVDSLGALRASVSSGFALLESHAHHENVYIGPTLERFVPDLARRIGGTHDAHEPEMGGLLAMLDSIDPVHPGAAMSGHRFVVALSKLSAELMLHMAEEEEVVMPALWEVLTDEQLIAIEQRLVANVPPERMAQFLNWMIPSMNTPERVNMLSSMRASAPNEVFEGTRKLARALLSPEDDEALSKGLAA